MEIIKLIHQQRDLVLQDRKSPVEIHLGSVAFAQFMNEVSAMVLVDKIANVFFYAGMQVLEKEDLRSDEIRLLTKEQIKDMDFEGFKKHLHLL